MSLDQKLEFSINELEAYLQTKVTIVDRAGYLHLPDGTSAFTRTRLSHRKNTACLSGFCQNCVRHCRYEVNSHLDKSPFPYVHHCWKGLAELAIPMIYEGQIIGTFFAGIHRDPNGTPPMAELPDDFMDAYKSLPVLPEGRLRALTPFLETFVSGLVHQLFEDQQCANALGSDRRSRIERFMQLHAHRQLRLNDLAEHMCLSPTRTSHVVKELFGCSFQKLLISKRLKHAELMLVSTDLTAAEIADATGFSDEFHFNRLFKREYGTPPGRYRSS